MQSVARRLGFFLEASWRMQDKPLFDHLRTVFERFEVDAVLDVGANVGQYAEMIRHNLGFKGQIFSFEPIPDAFRRLEEFAAADPNWFVFNYALGEADGVADFNVMRNSSLSSFHNPVKEEGPEQDGLDIVSRIAVTIRTLDDVVPELIASHGVKNFYLKMDTQGFDLAVLRGARRVMGSIVALQSEACNVRLYGDAPDFQTMTAAYREMGLVISNVFPAYIDERLRAIDLDCILVKDI